MISQIGLRGRLDDAYTLLSALSMSTSGSPFVVCVFCAELDMVLVALVEGTRTPVRSSHWQKR